MSRRTYNDPNSDAARQALLDNRCEHKPKNHRTLGRRRRLSKEKRQRIKANVAEKVASGRRYKAKVKAYWETAGIIRHEQEMMDQLDPHLNVITPLGAARAIGVTVGEADQTMWLVFIKTTGEPWYFRNPYIRLAPEISEGRGKPSPFHDVPVGLEPHIERYRANGWLPRT